MLVVRIAFLGCLIALAGALHELAPETTMMAAGLIAFVIVSIVFGIGERIWQRIYFRWRMR
jgi:hypothetical protein